jgi:hypothetical protein
VLGTKPEIADANVWLEAVRALTALGEELTGAGAVVIG